jgi:hypothetical protein
MGREYSCGKKGIGKDTTQIKDGFMRGRPEIFERIYYYLLL